jgi:hypothetical protein
MDRPGKSVRAYRNLLKHLTETAPEQLRALPHSFLVEQARWMLRRGEIYALEQVNKHVSLLAALPTEDLARATETALDKGAVDGFCFLYARLPPADRPTPARIDAACSRLARRGNAAGIEQIIAATGVTPVITEETALRAYDVLVAAGRLGAVDYVRQLSGVPARFHADAVSTGVRTLLASGRYSALRTLAHEVGHKIGLDADDVRRAVRDALADATLCELADALVSLGIEQQVEGFTACFNRLVAEERFTEVPALFFLCRDADWRVLDDGVWSRLMTSASAAAVRFAYEHCDDTETLGHHAFAAYELGVANSDRLLVRLACERGGAALRRRDAPALLDDAMEDGDVIWVDFAVGQLGTLPAPDPDRAQLFLAQRARHHPEKAARDAEALGVAPDLDVGQWLLDLADRHFEDAARAASRITAHHVAAAVGSMCAQGTRCS